MGCPPMIESLHFHRGYSLRLHKSKPFINYGIISVPAPHTAQFRGGPAAKQRGKHDPKDFDQELVLTPQPPFNLGDEVFRKPQVIEGLLEGLSGPLRLAAVVRKALLRGAISAASGFGVFFHGPCAWG